VSSGNHLLDRLAAIAWRLIVVAIVTIGLLSFLRQVQVLVLALLVSLAIASLLTPLAERMVDRDMPRFAAAWLLVLGFLGLLVGTVVLLIPPVVDQFRDLGPTLEEGRDQVEEWLIDGPFNLTEGDLERYTDDIVGSLQGRSDQIASGVVSGAIVAAEVIVGFLLTLVLVFFFVKDGEKITAWLLRQVREEHHDLARAIGQRTFVAGGGYIRGTSIVALADAVGIAIGLTLIGVPLVLPLAVLTFFGGFFPLVGATVAGLVAVLVALVSGGVTDAALALGVVLIVQQTESNLLEPLVLSRAVRIHPIGVLIFLTAGGLVAGIVGAFVAVPTAAIAVAIAAELRERDLIGPNRRKRRPTELEAPV
jgi:putative heme transporter